MQLAGFCISYQKTKLKLSMIQQINKYETKNTKLNWGVITDFHLSTWEAEELCEFHTNMVCILSSGESRLRRDPVSKNQKQTQQKR